MEHVITHRGTPLRVYSSHNGDAHYCGEYSYELTEDDTNPMWVGTLDEAVMTIGFPTPWYNSRSEHPGLGSYKPEQLKIMRMEVKLHSVNYPKPFLAPEGAIYNIRDIPKLVAKGLMGKKELPKSKRYTLVHIRKGVMKRSSLDKVVGNFIHFDSYTKRKLFGVFKPRDEYKEHVEFECVMGPMEI